MALKTHMKFSMAEPDFLQRFFFCPQNCENRPEMGQRWVFKFIEKFGINFY